MNPSTKTQNVEKMSAHDQLITDLLGGTSAFRAAGRTYLIQNPAESAESYNNRLKQAVLFPAFKSTVFNLSSKPFEESVTPESDFPADLLPYLQDINQEGENLTVFANNVLEASLAYGISYILADYPPAPENLTREQENALGLRPYLCHIRKTDVIGISSTRMGGVQKLTEFRYWEQFTEAGPNFTETTIKQIRVLKPGVWEIWRIDERKEWYLFETGITTLDFVPIVPVYSNRTGFMTGEPLMLELAHMNVKLYNSQSEQQNIVHVARVPLLLLVGADSIVDDQGGVKASVQSLTSVPEGGDMKWVEHSGKAIEAGRQFEIDIMEQMTQAHADLLQRRVVRATATEANQDKSAQMSVLQSVVSGLQDSLNTAIEYMAQWIGEQSGTVTVFSDFSPLDLALGLQALQTALDKGLISEEGAFVTLQKMGFLDESLDFATEREKRDLQAPTLASDKVISMLPNLARIGA